MRGFGLHPDFMCKCVEKKVLDILEAKRKAAPSGPEQMLIPSRSRPVKKLRPEPCPMAMCIRPRPGC